ncbi:MAG: hypothetical protein KatS3mg063_2679 [Tepidiforma sp.]|uniref:hypothetical protein n=1 Tax=Tepidiforma sp. TaxID=2682230 RepID=UPI0021DBAE8D|nr:hypothetical protein [Tepidiforma sp.]GIW16826.1 MAG: hypothetical protein KatS3mg063_2679 [Tepidiforma sp.]
MITRSANADRGSGQAPPGLSLAAERAALGCRLLEQALARRYPRWTPIRRRRAARALYQRVAWPRVDAPRGCLLCQAAPRPDLIVPLCAACAGEPGDGADEA